MRSPKYKLMKETKMHRTDQTCREETYRVTWEGDRKRLVGTEGPLKHEGDLPVNKDALSVITNLPKPSLLNNGKVDVDSKSVTDRNDNIVGRENIPPEKETKRSRGGGVASSSGGAKTSDADTSEGRTGVKDPVATLAEEDLPKILIRDVCDVSNTILGLPGPEFIQNLIPSIHQVDEEEEEEVVSPLPVNQNVSYDDDENTILGLPGPEFSQLSSASEQTFQEVVLGGAVPLSPCNQTAHHQQAVTVVSSGGVMPTSSMAQQLQQQQQQQQVSVSLQQATLQNPPAIAPAPLPPQSGTTTITTMSTLHQPLQHPMPPPTPQTITQHQGVPHSQLQQVNEWGHGRVITAGKPFQPNQIPQQMLTAQKSMLQGQTASFPGYATIPTTTNQTLVISQVGLISNPQNILPAHSAAGGKPGEMQKVNVTCLGGVVGKHASFVLSLTAEDGEIEVMASKNVAGNAVSLKGGVSSQQSTGYMVSQPQQLITTQTPTTAMLGTGQTAQFLSPIQYTTCGGGRAVQQNGQPVQFSPWQFGGPSLPQGITWATTPGGLQPSALLTTQNPIFIRSQQDGTGMFIQSPPPQIQSHNPALTATQAPMPSVQQMTGKPRQAIEMPANIQPKTAVSRTLSNILPSMAGSNNIRPASSVSTQTGPGQMNAAQVQTQKPQGDFFALLGRAPGGDRFCQLLGTPVLLYELSIPVMQQSPSQSSTQPSPSHTPTPQEPQRPTVTLTPCPPSIPLHTSSSTPIQVMATSTPPPPATTPAPVLAPPPAAPTPPPANFITLTPVPIQAPQISKDEITKPSEEMPDTPMEVQENGTNEAPGDIKDKSLTENSSSALPEELREKEKEKGPPKAMVKPTQVLTHVIDGFVIHEANEPFGMIRSPLLDDLPLMKRNHDSEDNLLNGNEPQRKKHAPDNVGGKPEMAACEFCGKMDLRSKFKKSKRFCSLTCAKSKRVGQYRPNNIVSNHNNNTINTNNNNSVDSQGKKGPTETQWQKPASKKLDGVSGQPEGATPTDENTDTNDSAASGAESSLAGSEAPEVPIADMEDSSTSESGPSAAPSTPRVNPLRWTVSDVCEFIKNLPGCLDYVEDFAIQEIDGQALMLLKEDHLMSAMSMKLGPALKICAKIDTMRSDNQK
uniref:Polyhomeotic-like protein 2 n=1 Tax=Timema bartmani TaxID=61472 RepID=A0A7R9EVN4_9NEOP|nr:unnamed protein product [Timema bartmani]